jgi:hypothetical protein
MRTLSLDNVLEEIQDYVATNSGLGYVVAENFTIGNPLDWHDIDDLLGPGSRVDLSMHDERPTIRPTGRREHIEWPIRFVTKGDTANGALSRARSLATWLFNTHTFETAAGIRVWFLRAFASYPGLLARGDSGVCLADFTTRVLVLQR